MTDIHGSADYRRHLVLGLVKAALAKASSSSAHL